MNKIEKHAAEVRTALANMFASFNEVESKQLLFIDEPTHRVLISDMLVAPLSKNDKLWKNFFDNLGTWLRFRLYMDYWNRRCIDAEAAAIRKAMAEYGALTVEERRRILVDADLSLMEPDGGCPDVQFDSYEFCVCSGILRAGAEATAVGVWTDGRVVLEMVKSEK